MVQACPGLGEFTDEKRKYNFLTWYQLLVQYDLTI